jgi:hypothetical protein
LNEAERRADAGGPNVKAATSHGRRRAVRSLDLSASAALQGRATVLEPQNSRDLLLVSACFILPFLSRMILAPLWRGFPFWQVEPIGAPPNCFDAEERESLLRMSLDL